MVAESARDQVGADEAGAGAKRKRRRGGRKHHKSETGASVRPDGEGGGEVAAVEAAVAAVAPVGGALGAKPKATRKRAPRRRPAPAAPTEE